MWKWTDLSYSPSLATTPSLEGIGGVCPAFVSIMKNLDVQVTVLCRLISVVSVLTVDVIYPYASVTMSLVFQLNKSQIR